MVYVETLRIGKNCILTNKKHNLQPKSYLAGCIRKFCGTRYRSTNCDGQQHYLFMNPSMAMDVAFFIGDAKKHNVDYIKYIMRLKKHNQ